MKKIRERANVLVDLSKNTIDYLITRLQMRFEYYLKRYHTYYNELENETNLSFVEYKDCILSIKKIIEMY